ncbi:MULTISPECIES: sodium/glutamate symporter [unclassified Agarivorans]|uniref:sodium/glutamate symporter n=1 Tax=unclassified Agarivorans TaxID=2636026 RepID=UPI0010DC888F|nr:MULTISPECIES: sodium/glutamate symporter [unclassified Agarivorans]MDO6684181.1 sodium/glutamate symporter [Agarivorans sp. 3_MG-2023]MDO6714085.1 sodium/glutamate symporter [Agarivorans sp. 2_MG-2023]MDO6762671.1 sodium/glutamate symporter [Agarivorans sp. 1_MG-2023]GDY24793.1 sodium/glutamate symporter [Agarivorans sp. Toyoura001]
MGIEFNDGVLVFDSFFTATIGILVLFIGRRINRAVNFLREFSIPEPVTGGILFSVIIGLIYALTSVEIEFTLIARDILLVYFFTTIGINSSLKDLLKGGMPLVILLGITIGYMILQNLTGITVAKIFGLDSAVGLLGGSVSLIGGHGTAIAWAPRIAEDFGVTNAMEIGIASATFGLILASLMGGPIAQFLVNRHNLSPKKDEPLDVGVAEENKDKGITGFDFLDAILAIHICVILGFILNEIIANVGLQLPLFVTCLFAGIVMTNLVPSSLPRITGTQWPTRKPAIALIADISLGTFLAMSLMSMQLWTLIDLAGPIFAILSAQFVIAILVNIFIVFPAMGKSYDAAVICSGFGGISLGSTPTAMANMSAVSQRYGNSHLAFIIVPLVCAFFIDLVNALLIPFFLANF